MKKKTVFLVLICLTFSLFALSETDLKWRSDVEISPATPSAGDTVTFRCRMKNARSESDNVNVIARIDGTQVYSHTYPHLGLDEYVWVEFTWTAVAGAHSVLFVLDPGNTIAEVNEANNERSLDFRVAAAAGGGSGLDLLWVGDMRATPDDFNPGDRVTLTGTVQANGAAASDVRVSFHVDGTRSSQQTIPAIPAGGTADVTFSWVAEAGYHTGEFIIDPLNAITETNEGNNTLTQSGTIEERSPGGGEETPTEPADLLWVSDVTLNPEVPKKGRRLTIAGSVKAMNTSLRNVEIRLSVYRSSGGLRMFLHDDSKVFRLLSDNSPAEATFDWTPPSTGRIEIQLTAIPPSDFTDTTPMNNRIVKMVTVQDAPSSTAPTLGTAPTMATARLKIGSDELCELNKDKQTDLIVRSMTSVKRVDQNRIKFKVIIRNEGKKCVESFRWEIVDRYGQLLYRETASHLPGKRYAIAGNIGRVFYVTLDDRIIRRLETRRIRVGSRYKIKEGATVNVTVDPNRVVPESNESNNTLGPRWIEWRQSWE